VISTGTTVVIEDDGERDVDESEDDEKVRDTAVVGGEVEPTPTHGKVRCCHVRC